MLKGIPSILSPELLKVLCEMGHSDTIVIADGNFPSETIGKDAIVIRADGHGVPELMAELARRVSVNEESDGILKAQRHIELAREAARALENAIGSIEAGIPLDTVAIDIREALEDLSEITGENAAEAVIDRVFSSFCVGK